MKTKKITKLCALLLMLAMLLTACGEKSTDNTSAPAATNGGSDVTTTESAAEPAESVNIEDWGVDFKNVATSGLGEMLPYWVKYPSLVPADKATATAFQTDPTLALVGYGGEKYRSTCVENVLPDCMEHIIENMDFYRSIKYKDFAFNILATEATTINGLPACKYTGTHSFKIHDDEYEIPFVAYSLDLKEKPEAYIYIMVLDESVLHTERPAVEDGVIEDYAYKMACSVVLADSEFA